MASSGPTHRIQPVLLSGGSGTRLWPLSVPERPKQFIALVGETTLLQQTAGRVGDAALFDPPIVVAGRDQAEPIERQLAEMSVSPSLLILEPCARNTAPAIALAALNCDGDSLLLVLPSDHRIEDEPAFRAAVEAALPCAAEDWLVTFGAAPDRPETGYGYIRRGEPLRQGVFRADAFVEKPDRETAERFIREGGHVWNAGIFLFRASAYLRALEEYAPDIFDAVRASVAGQSRDGCRLSPGEAGFERSPSQPIDIAVMERSRRVAVVPVDMGWSDVGSWDALYEFGSKDPRANVIAGDAHGVETQGCLIRSDGPRILAVGVEDLVIVATRDSVLVVPRGESQRVKEALAELNRRKE
jgi:mannose-1-phosphate guanylyltransferase/mannose-1-phosphate guanylyltransferase/mannose-6-phosphate isomerase